jgi:peptidoglycan/LPS O-acetylase OafA/YrhL
VIGFHAGIAGFGGGFAGVDVFFVISGYLISGIILKALEKGTFTFAEFYVRRINRILPALVIVLLATALLGWLFLFSRELPALGKHILGGSTFVSNFSLWKETGYFDARNKPLLHLWSLAVEEQFYLVFPAIAIVAWKLKWSLRWTLIAMIEISFVANVWAVRHGQGTAAFYLPVTRFWEILAGALLFELQWRGIRRHARVERLAPVAKKLAPLVGFGLLVAGLAFSDETKGWPGLWALVPVMGTVLLVAAGPDTPVNRYLLAHPLLVGVGLISYPLYLWHWPLLVFGKFVNESNLEMWIRLLLVAVSVLLAWATYRFVEIPIRFGNRKRRSATLLLPALAASGALGLAIFFAKIPARLDWSEARWASRWGTDWEPLQTGFTKDRTGMLIYSIAGDSANTLAFIGDSHALQYWPRIEALAQRRDPGFPKVVMVSMGSCPPLPAVNVYGVSWDQQPYACDAAYRAQMEYASRRSVRTVVISAFWEDYFINRHVYVTSDPSQEKLRLESPGLDYAFRLLELDVQRLVDSGKRVVIILPNPTSPMYTPSNLPRRLAGFRRKDVLPPIVRKDFEARTFPMVSRLRKLAAATGAELVNPVVHLCGESVCPTKGPGGIPMYWDDDHLRNGYVRDYVTYLDGVISRPGAPRALRGWPRGKEKGGAKS